MKKQRVVRTNPEKLAEILYDAIKRYIHSKNEKKQLDFQFLNIYQYNLLLMLYYRV